MTLAGVGGDQSLSLAEPSSTDVILRPMKVEEIAEVVAKLPPDQTRPIPPLVYRIRGGPPRSRPGA
jgi:hypothetical protein